MTEPDLWTVVGAVPPTDPAASAENGDGALRPEDLVSAYLSMMFAECDPPLTLPQAVQLEEVTHAGSYPLWTKLSDAERAELDAIRQALSALDIETARATLRAIRRAGVTADQRPNDAALVAWYNARVAGGAEGAPIPAGALPEGVADQLWAVLQAERNGAVAHEAEALVGSMRAQQEPLHARQAELRRRAEATAAERVALRERFGLMAVPSLTEWLRTHEIDGDHILRASACLIVAGGQHLAEERTPEDEMISPSARALLLPFVNGDAAQRDQLALLERRLEDAEQRAREAEQRAAALERQVADVQGQIARRPTLRQGTAALRAMLHTEVKVTEARRKAQQNDRLTPEQIQARKVFKYQPLGWAERLVVHACASIARDQGLLNTHPWALTRRPIAGQPAHRVALPFPGISEIARVIGCEADASGKINRADRRTIERALADLCQKPRWIAMPIMYPAGKKGGKTVWKEDVEVRQTLWIEPSETLISRGAFLNLHPAAVASHLESYVDVPNLLAQYEAAKEAIGLRQMRDDLAVCDDYLRLLARAQLAKRRKLVRGDDGKTLVPVRVPAGETPPTVEAKTSQERMLATLDLVAWAKKHGATPAVTRVREALAFCRAMGSLVEAEYVNGIWHMRLPHPDSLAGDDREILLLENMEAS